MSDLISRKEIIDRLERVIQNGVPSEDGMHPISAETVLEVVKELSEHGTNLAEVGTDCISRQVAIDAVCNDYCGGHQDCKYYPNCENLRSVQKLPSAQPEIVRCEDCRYYNHEEKECLDLLGYGRRWEEDDYCSYGAKMEVNHESN